MTCNGTYNTSMIIEDLTIKYCTYEMRYYVQIRLHEIRWALS